MASRFFSNQRDNAADFFAIGSGAVVAAVGFLGLAEDPLRIFMAGVFAAFAVTLYVLSVDCWLKDRKFRRQAILTRMAADVEALPEKQGHRGR